MPDLEPDSEIAWPTRTLTLEAASEFAGINEALLTTLAACGDVERNVMACPAALADAPHALVRDMARDIAARLRPATGAYHEIWLDGEKVVSTEPEEPFYGAQYLPRKFKTGIAIDTDNCIDVFSDDCGLVAIVDDGRVRSFDVVVGGGMGMTHRQADTFAALGRPLGFVGAQDAVEAVRTVAAICRDHGNREDRRHARLKFVRIAVRTRRETERLLRALREILIP